MSFLEYAGKHLSEIAMPIGGMGTGCISVSGSGELVDWEIYNRANKGFRPKWTFLSLRAKTAGGKPAFRVLEGVLRPPFQGADDRLGWGPARDRVSGLPRMRKCVFSSIYPIARVQLSDPDVPLSVTLESFNPLIPGNSYDSSLPALFLNVLVANVSDKSVETSISFNMTNPVGYPVLSNELPQWQPRDNVTRGFFFSDRRYLPDHPRHGTAVLTTGWDDITYQASYWFEDHDYPGYYSWLDTFIAAGRFNDEIDHAPKPQQHLFPVASLATYVDLPPGQSVTIPYTFCWHIPWTLKNWNRGKTEDPNLPPTREDSTVCWRNYYTNSFSDAWDVASYVAENRQRLEDDTHRYTEAFSESRLPPCVLDAVTSQISTLKTPTTLRLSDGTLWGWEGCAPDTGVCWGSSNHVWGFAQSAPYLFSDADRSMLESFYRPEVSRESDGYMASRVDLPLGTDSLWVQPASDGQFTMVLRMYRSWQLKGDDEWIREYWPKISKSLEYAFTVWDKDRDGFMEQPHGHTYDGVFTSAEPQSQMLYLAAIRACEEIAKYLGDGEKAVQYRGLFLRGSALTDEKLFNGEYYQQLIEPGQSLRQQLASGCLIDQLQGQWHATNLGLGYLVEKNNARGAIGSVFRYNFMKEGYHDWINRYRTFALDDERGTVICTWPHGDRPKVPFLYCDETMIGFEYQLACLLIQEGYVSEGLKVVKAVRDRFDGYNRNPWNEFECGSHYARSMASYGLLLAISGFEYSAVKKHIGFSPALDDEDFSSFFSVPDAWGVYRQHPGKAELEIMGGELDVRTFRAGKLGVFDVSAPASVGDMIEVGTR